MRRGYRKCRHQWRVMLGSRHEQGTAPRDGKMATHGPGCPSRVNTLHLGRRQMRFRTAVIAGALVASGVIAGKAEAQIAVSGTTRGCFGLACTGVGLATFQGLLFNGGTFSGITD